MPTKSQQTAFYKKLPIYMRKIREDAGLSQRVLGEKIGKNQAWVFKCETSIRRVDITEFVEWAAACGVDPLDACKQIISARK